LYEKLRPVLPASGPRTGPVTSRIQSKITAKFDYILKMGIVKGKQTILAHSIIPKLAHIQKLRISNLVIFVLEYNGNFLRTIKESNDYCWCVCVCVVLWKRELSQKFTKMTSVLQNSSINMMKYKAGYISLHSALLIK
jgi:hypothetical protein